MVKHLYSKKRKINCDYGIFSISAASDGANDQPGSIFAERDDPPDNGTGRSAVSVRSIQRTGWPDAATDSGDLWDLRTRQRLWSWAALEELGQDLPYYQPCNEQSMVHTAVGFSKATYRRQTMACSSSIGPGATNMLSGAALATINHLPVLLLPSDYYATRYQGPVLQQLEHPISADVSVNDAFRPLSRFFDRISRPE